MKYEKEQTDELWTQYGHRRSGTVKKKLVEIYYPFVKQVARQVAEKLNYKVSPDELSSAGVDGLYRAIELYESDRGIKFESYAQQRVRGSMIDWLRQEDLIPRSVRMNYNKMEGAKQRLQGERKGRVTDEEVAEDLGVSVEFCKNKKKFHPVAFCSLDAVSRDEGGDGIGDDSNVNLEDKNADVAEIQLKRQEFFNKLMGNNFTRMERTIVYLYYYKDLTMDKVARRVGLSESRVSQMHKRILPRLKHRIQRNPKYFGDDIFSYMAESSVKFNPPAF